MEWLGLYTFNFLSSIAAYLFLSGDDRENRNPNDSLFDLPVLGLSSIAQSLVSTDLSSAKQTWEQVLHDQEVPRDGNQTYQCLNHIVHRVETNLLDQPDFTCFNSVLVTLLKFIGYSTSSSSMISLSQKAEVYATVFYMNELLWNSSYPNNYFQGVYTLAKFAGHERIERVSFPKRPSDTLNLFQMIPPPVWLLAMQRNVIIQNVKYQSFLYVGREGAKNNGPLQLFMWNQKHLTNRNQAVFRFLESSTVPGENETSSVPPECSSGLQNQNLIMYQPVMKLVVNLPQHHCSSNESQSHLLAIKSSTNQLVSLIISDVTWNIQLIDSTGNFRLSIHSKCGNGTLTALPPPPESSRSQVTILSNLPHDELNEESHWTIVPF